MKNYTYVSVNKSRTKAVKIEENYLGAENRSLSLSMIRNIKAKKLNEAFLSYKRFGLFLKPLSI